MMIETFRKEVKYLITLDDYYRLSGSLSALMRADPHNGVQGYKVRSLYFDSLNDSDFFDKQNGLELRKKIRLRRYGTEGQTAKLEMKKKEGNSQLKRSVELFRNDAQRLCRGDYSPLLERGEFARECYGIMQMYAYRPKAIVEYDRTAFMAPEFSTRVTFDRGIAATESSADLFSDKMCLYPVFDPFLVVMEVKYSGFLLAYVKDALERVEKSELSVSKYCLSRAVGLHYDFV